MTHNAHHTPEPLSIVLMRSKIDTHQREAIRLTSKGMFYTAKEEIDKCIILSGKIGKELVRGV